MKSPDRIEIYQFSLHVDRLRLRQLAAHLSAEERERVRRLGLPLNADRFIAARGTVREILASAMGGDPSAIVFDYGPYGKPRLAGRTHSVDFSLSHSGSAALLAISGGPRVGVDIEEVRDHTTLESVARLLFSEREVEALENVPVEDRLRAFYRCWTCKEALANATGQGLGADVPRFEVFVSAREPAGLLSVNGSKQEAARWTLGHVALDAAFVAAFAVEVPSCGVALRGWPGEGSLS